MNRRTCMKLSSSMGLGLALSPANAILARDNHKPIFDHGIHIFSKHLQWLDYDEMAAAAKEMGFDGVDLTVRPKGHILPENVERDLPKAVEAVRKAGLKAELITTAITSAADPYTEKIIRTASQQGIKYYRMGWLKYHKNQPIPEQLELYKKQLKELEQLNQSYNIHGAYQNHSGDGVGAAVWDIWDLNKRPNPRLFGLPIRCPACHGRRLEILEIGLGIITNTYQNA